MLLSQGKVARMRRVGRLKLRDAKRHSELRGWGHPEVHGTYGPILTAFMAVLIATLRALKGLISGFCKYS